MSGLIPFEFDGRAIRVITDDDGTLHFVAMDAAEALGYNWQSNVIAHVPADWKGVKRINTPGGMQSVSTLTEQGLYFFLGRSDKPKALPFQRWMAGDVLPSIRKTGAYVASGAPATSLVDGAVQALKLAPLAIRAARAFGLDKNVAAISANQYVCTVTGHNLLKEFGATHLPAERQDTQWFTPTELSSEAQVSARKLNEALSKAGLQERRGKAWELTPAGHAFARLFDTGKRHNSGTMVQQIKWSPRVLQELRHTGSLI